jgi:serine/threonine protein kinase
MARCSTAAPTSTRLGAVLYHLIAGRPPFEASSQAVLMHQIYNQMPTALHRPALGRAPSAVDAVVLKALAKDPKDRYRRTGTPSPRRCRA